MIFIVQTLISWLVARGVSKVCRFNARATNFVTAMGVFGNSNSLPISLVISLSETLKGLHWDRIPGDTDDEVAARGVAEGGGRVLHDLLAGRGHAGRIGQRQVVLVQHLLGGGNGNLAGLGELVVLESGAAQLGAFVGVVVLGRGVLGHSVSPARVGAKGLCGKGLSAL